RGRGDLDGLAGCRVPGRTSGPVGLLERTESGDGDLLALGHRGLDGLQDGVDGLGSGLLAAQSIRDRVDQLALVHWVYSSGSPLAPTKLGDLWVLHNHLGRDSSRVVGEFVARGVE